MMTLGRLITLVMRISPVKHWKPKAAKPTIERLYDENGNEISSINWLNLDWWMYVKHLKYITNEHSILAFWVLIETQIKA